VSPQTKAAAKPKPAPKPEDAGIAYEQALADKAAAIRGEALDVGPKLLLELWPLLRAPIHPDHLEHVEAVKGKPYDSTGVRSLQVQIDRMDNVLGPLSWGWRTVWSEQGTLAKVRVWIGPAEPQAPGDCLVIREAYGGVDRGSTKGNVYKGSETNAAKLAFARMGPGHEVYLGQADLDPDVSKAVAEAQPAESVQEPQKLTDEQAAKLTTAVTAAGLSEALGAKLRGFGKASIAELTYEQGLALYGWAQQEVQG
jgi:hypothetical protein